MENQDLKTQVYGGSTFGREENRTIYNVPAQHVAVTLLKTMPMAKMQQTQNGYFVEFGIGSNAQRYWIWEGELTQNELKLAMARKKDK